MTRLFKTHDIRETEELSGALWKMRKEGESEEEARNVLVPSCWEKLPGYEDFRGTCIYTREFTAGGTVRLVFEGVSHTATVRVDGERRAWHYNAYTPFEAVVPDLPAETHRLEVWVDNRFSEASALHVPNDYMTYGGIIRPVTLEYLQGGAYIEALHLTPVMTGGRWKLKIAAFVTPYAAQNPADYVVTTGFAAEDANGMQALCYEREENGQWIFTGELEAAKVRAWTPGEPALYAIRTLLHHRNPQTGRPEEPFDDRIERVGFRSVEVRGNRILLNGETMRIKGFCRHEDHELFGNALPLSVMEQDLQQMRDMGANSVRCTHYPNDQRFLDLCDEHGILVWEENHARGLSEKDMRNPNFEPQAENCIREMIHAHYNHPSIYIWGMLNECASETDYGRECYIRQISLIRSLDTSRPATFATCKFTGCGGDYDGQLQLTDKCLDLPDVVSYNMYPLWYFDTDIPTFLADMQEQMEKSDGRGKPFLVSEIGAGAVYGWHDAAKAKWSEEYQAETVGRQLTAVLESEACTGVYIWQFADCRVSREWFSVRPRSHNNKGIVDEYRRPKMAYRAVKDIFCRYGNYKD